MTPKDMTRKCTKDEGGCASWGPQVSGLPRALIGVKHSVIRGGTAQAVVALAALPSLIGHILPPLRADPAAQAPGREPYRSHLRLQRTASPVI